ncbi:MAG: peptide chain release factor 2 [Parcubacteria group bacterium]|jgi:peptide chain release factor 2|nr:peptide chain release factor 2 [Parcubacteria group bacterium]|tara:strand:- start:12043 stop:12810 length:768 start_codon:yes stop_codon:yes gene_type:complete
MKDLTERLTGQYDRRQAILSIYAGAGGTDAQDWAEMLLGMYLKFIKKNDWSAQVIEVKGGKEAGIKNATLAIETAYAYGYLKGESGVHRLVRLSPFNADHLRHTSFALVEVLPQFKEMKEINIRPEDLRVETFRASGPGGQYVNKVESAVRITHLPTGIVVSCQNERLQGANKKRAMEWLYSKLHQYNLKGQEEKKRQIRGELSPAEWGSQIRSYVLHPYQMVKDHRTGVKIGSPQRVLDGKLDKFIEGFIKKTA